MDSRLRAERMIAISYIAGWHHDKIEAVDQFNPQVALAALMLRVPATTLADEVRAYIIETASAVQAHFAGRIAA